MGGHCPMHRRPIIHRAGIDRAGIFHRTGAGSAGLLAHTVLAAKFIDAPGRINDLLFAGIERMTYRADIDVQLIRQCRLRLKFVATATNNLNLVVLRMNVGFHDFAPCLELSQSGQKGARA